MERRLAGNRHPPTADRRLGDRVLREKPVPIRAPEQRQWLSANEIYLNLSPEEVLREY